MSSRCALATVVAHSPHFAGDAPKPPLDAVLRVSRFAYLRYEDELVLASPRAHAHLVVHAPEVLLVYHRLCAGASFEMLARELVNRIDADELYALVELLLLARIVEPVGADGLIEEPSPLRQWEFHDLLLHAESRMGRARHPVGGTHRFVGTLAAPPARAPRAWPGPVIALAPPSADDGYDAVTLAGAIERRRSVREQGELPITLAAVGDFLYRTARVVDHTDAPWPREYPHGGDYTRRLYPGGGARYELEVYLVVNRCQGLERGLYHYDAFAHHLALVTPPCAEMEGVLHQARMASGGWETQVLVVVASRFQRCSWKYEGLALALQLKNLGVLYANLYLVAAAMGLACCGLGAGDSDLFSRLSKLDYLVEGSIGELLLGTRTSDSLP
jgi:SagB-type dehydrogenase family enzyme